MPRNRCRVCRALSICGHVRDRVTVAEDSFVSMPVICRLSIAIADSVETEKQSAMMGKLELVGFLGELRSTTESFPVFGSKT